ncbi:hypothetical protein DL96DRAFT_809574 [Flagelloscypha sp. PMI_526]|nr:hypothetical protein DL96DRAFT_809574 [Flagelloscypha sp. PMI_526]
MHSRILDPVLTFTLRKMVLLLQIFPLISDIPSMLLVLLLFCLQRIPGIPLHWSKPEYQIITGKRPNGILIIYYLCS